MIGKKAFTLAEVLITLGIIGVVAAMSIPTLIANINSAKFSSQFKKSFATLNQAALMSQNHYDFDFAGADAACTSDGSDDPKTVNSICALLNGTLSGITTYMDSRDLPNGYMFLPGAVRTPSIVKLNGMAIYRMADGSFFVFPKTAKSGCSLEPGQKLDNYIWDLIDGGCYGYIDVNGEAKPNIEVNCGNYSYVDTVPSSPCLVAKNSTQMTDVYPVVYHDGVLEPATNAASYVLSGGTPTKLQVWEK